MKRFVSGIIDLLFPPVCLCCGERTQLEPICRKCLTGLEPTNLSDWLEQVTNHDFLDCAYSGWYFNHNFQKLIHELKYSEGRLVAQILGQKLGVLLKEELSNLWVDAIVPVPLHPARLRERGFNQSTLLGYALAKELGLTCREDILRRRRNTVSQTKLGSEERKQNMQNAFTCKTIRNSTRLLLIDDVLTTGSTLSACAEVLKSSGVEFVGAVTAGTPLSTKSPKKEVFLAEA